MLNTGGFNPKLNPFTAKIAMACNAFDCIERHTSVRAGVKAEFAAVADSFIDHHKAVVTF
jgi:hypothetical protein